MRMIKRHNQLFVTFGGGPRKRNEHGKGFENRRKNRPPKLFRFCASGGLLDQDVAARMSRGEMMKEAGHCIGYAVKGLGTSVGNMASSIARGTGQMATGICKLVGTFFR